jgi:pimeloyl-ACP methyl ester carboxylesterase
MTHPRPPALAPATFVLLPGAGGDAWYWHRVTDALEAGGHRVVAVDLPADDDAAGLDAYVDATIAAVGDHPPPLVLVAQSMAGLTAPLVCRRLPIHLLVLVNAMIPRPGESGGEWWEATGQARARAELAARQGHAVTDEIDVVDDFLHDAPEEVIAEAMSRGPLQQSGTPFSEPVPFDGWPDVPTRVLVGRDDRFFPASFQRRVARERLAIEPEEIPGGHLLALCCPQELADRLQGYWSEVS